MRFELIPEVRESSLSLGGVASRTVLLFKHCQAIFVTIIVDKPGASCSPIGHNLFLLADTQTVVHTSGQDDIDGEDDYDSRCRRKLQS